MTYKQPVEQVLDFLRETFGSTFNAYYNGDPDLIPNFQLPAIVAVKLSDSIGSGPTGFRRITEQIQVKVVYNKMDDWSAQNEETKLTEKKIRDIVEARDPETGAYKPGTLKHALMHRFVVDGLALNDALTFELGTVMRPEDGFTNEGHLTLTLEYLVQNANRLDG